MIENLEKKLNGEIPIKRFELVELIASQGTNEENIQNECYPLENLDTSFIEDFSNLFIDSLYSGDLSKWNISSGQNFNKMFMDTNNLNFELTNWIKQIKNNKNNFEEISFDYMLADSSISEKYNDGYQAGYFKSDRFWFQNNFDNILKIDLELNINKLKQDIENNQNEFDKFIKNNKIEFNSKEYKSIESKLNETQKPFIDKLIELENQKIDIILEKN